VVPVSRRLVGILGLAAIAGSLVAACSRATPIPAGAQQVHVVVTPSDVQLRPARVRAGDVYLVLDAPADGSLAFVSRSGPESPVLSPLAPGDLERLARGDTEATSISGLDAGGCSPAQNAEDRGQMGPCGNVMKVQVREGTYAILGGAPEAGVASGSPHRMAALIVVP
jgi:hypothetical protein